MNDIFKLIYLDQDNIKKLIVFLGDTYVGIDTDRGNVNINELFVKDRENNLIEYKIGIDGLPSTELQKVQETLFNEKKKIIEKCLFGVDINPNSVKICRFRGKRSAGNPKNYRRYRSAHTAVQNPPDARGNERRVARISPERSHRHLPREGPPLLRPASYPPFWKYDGHLSPPFRLKRPDCFARDDRTHGAAFPSVAVEWGVV